MISINLCSIECDQLLRFSQGIFQLSLYQVILLIFSSTDLFSNFSVQVAGFSYLCTLFFASNSHCKLDQKQPAIPLVLPESCAALRLLHQIT